MERKDYFPVLDILRFIACSGVLLTHSTLFFKAEDRPFIFGGLVTHAGYFGVVFFYVLSGFLITGLLLDEEKRTGAIDIRRFYVRRSLRIWPLYYFIVLLSFFVFPFLWPWKEIPPGGVTSGTLWYYIFFLPNLAAIKGTFIITCFQVYTIGYEEQFYLVWPWVIKGIRRRLPVFLGVVFAGHFLLEEFHLLLISHTVGRPGFGLMAVKGVLTYINVSNLPAFIAGAFSAWLYRRGNLKVIRWRGWTWILSIIVLLMMYTNKSTPAGYVNIVSILFAALILHLVLSYPEPGSVGRLLAKGGKISYGIYIYHTAILVFVSGCLHKSRLMSDLPSLAVYFIYLAISFLLILGISLLSYRYLEMPFLRLKQRFRH